MEKEKTNLYLFGIVGIVAVVGMVVLVLNAGTGGLTYATEDLSGQAIRITTSGNTCDPPCTGGKVCTDSGCKYPGSGGAVFISANSVKCCTNEGGGSCHAENCDEYCDCSIKA